jgi:hypothetical protein
MRLPSKTLHVAIILVAVFSASFLVAFLAIYLTPSPYLHERAHSSPTLFWHAPDLAPSSIGPALNATNVPLDTIIVVDQIRPMGVGELQLSPEAPIARRVDEHSGLAGITTIFYFSEPLKPATTYNATIFFSNTSISWNFTTTAEPYYPRYEALPSELGIFVAVTASTVVTLIVGLIIWNNRKRA